MTALTSIRQYLFEACVDDDYIGRWSSRIIIEHLAKLVANLPLNSLPDNIWHIEQFRRLGYFNASLFYKIYVMNPVHSL